MSDEYFETEDKPETTVMDTIRPMSRILDMGQSPYVLPKGRRFPLIPLREVQQELLEKFGYWVSEQYYNRDSWRVVVYGPEDDRKSTPMVWETEDDRFYGNLEYALLTGIKKVMQHLAYGKPFYG